MMGADSTQQQPPALVSPPLSSHIQRLVGLLSGTPAFTREGEDLYGQAYQHNAAYAKSGSYQTQLAPKEEKQFRAWVSANKVPTDPTASTSDYDMRGYWKALQQGTAKPWKGKGSHFPDTYKTPYDTTFSAESKYATPDNPFVWQGNKLVNKQTGEVVFAPSN